VSRRLFLLALEPLEERYTGQWFDWLPETFAQEFEVQVVTGEPLTDRVEVGAFLDLNSTAHYKATQLAKVARLFRAGEVRTGDAFFVADVEFWGMESLRYLSRLQGIRVYIFGFLHAASYTRGDFMEPMADLGRWAEPLWLATCDQVFVGTEYHRQALLARRLEPQDIGWLAEKVAVTGNPWRTDEARFLADSSEHSCQGRNIDVLFPHRPDQEKGIESFLRVIDGRGWRVAFTTGRETYRSTNAPHAAQQVVDMAERGEVELFTDLSRADFYGLLWRSKVVASTATEENFGYAMIEAMSLGALPIMPDAYSYPELVQDDARFLYGLSSTEATIANRVDTLLASPDSWREDVVNMARAFDDAEERILEEMVRICEST